MIYVSKLYHLCLYRCKFATVQIEMINQNIVFNSAFSLLSLLVFIFSLLLTSDLAPSHIRPSSSLNKERTKCGDRVWVMVEIGFRSRWRSVLGMDHSGDRFWVWVMVKIMFEGHGGDCVWDRFWVLVVSPSSVVWVSVPVVVGVSVVEPWLESVGAWVESVASDGYFGLGWIGVEIGWCSWVFWRKRHGRGHFNHCCSDLADLSLFWWLFVLIFGVGANIGCSVCLSFFFLGSSGWYWWSVFDLWGWPVVVGCGRCGLLLQLLLIMGEGIIYYFNV